MDARDTDGNTPLHQAVIGRETAFVQQLLDAKADPNLRNVDEECARDISGDWFGEHFGPVEEEAAAATAPEDQQDEVRSGATGATKV